MVAIFLAEKIRFLAKFFQIQNLRRRYTSLFLKKNRGFFFTFLRISLRKINVLKRTKLY